MMKSFCVVPILAAVLVVTGCTSVERSRDLSDPAVSAHTLAVQVCSNCHGIDGNSTSPNFPKLAQQQEQYFIAQMEGFKSKHRSDPAGFEYMWGLSRHLTDEQIKGLATYFAQQENRPEPMDNQAGLSARGAAIFQQGILDKQIPSCATCHGQNGQGMGPFPRLAGQHADYLVKQLTVFQRTDARPDGSVMKQVAHLLSPDDMQAVAVFLQGQPGS